MLRRAADKEQNGASLRRKVAKQSNETAVFTLDTDVIFDSYISVHYIPVSILILENL